MFLSQVNCMITQRRKKLEAGLTHPTNVKESSSYQRMDKWQRNREMKVIGHSVLILAAPPSDCPG